MAPNENKITRHSSSPSFAFHDVSSCAFETPLFPLGVGRNSSAQFPLQTVLFPNSSNHQKCYRGYTFRQMMLLDR